MSTYIEPTTSTCMFVIIFIAWFITKFQILNVFDLIKVLYNEICLS